MWCRGFRGRNAGVTKKQGVRCTMLDVICVRCTQKPPRSISDRVPRALLNVYTGGPHKTSKADLALDYTLCEREAGSIVRLDYFLEQRLVYIPPYVGNLV